MKQVGIVKLILNRIILAIIHIIPRWRSDSHFTVLPKVEDLKHGFPLNADRISKKYLAYFKDSISYDVRNVYILRNVYVNGMGVVFKNLRIFEPSLPDAALLVNFQNTYLLKQWIGLTEKFSIAEKPYALVWDHWSSDNYYHWMTESLGKLLVLKKYYSDCVLVLKKSMPEYVTLSASLLGFTDVVFIEEDSVCSFEQLIYPDLMSIRDVHNAALIKEVVEKITGSFSVVKSQSRKRVYVSRAQQQKRQVINEEKVIELMTQFDFEIAYFESMSVYEQIELMINTDILVGIHGANLTNIMFLKPGSKVIEMAGIGSKHLGYFYLASAVDVKYYWLGSDIVAGVGEGNDYDIEVDLIELENLLASVIK